VFGIYIRVSEVGGREGESFGSPDEQEVAAREWAERNGVEVETDAVVELDVSGATAVGDRKLGGLIERCESGELEGVIVRYEDRFARDVIEGALALKRIEECGARLIATASGFDSQHLTPDKRAWFSIQMAFAQAQREKNRDARRRGSQRAAERGLYLANRAPLGYRFVDRQRGGRKQTAEGGVGKLEPDPKTAKLVKQAFNLRAEGESFEKLGKLLSVAGKSSARAIIKSRVYVGEARVPAARTGDFTIVKSAHPPLVTEEQWEAANAGGGKYKPRTGAWADQARAGGLVFCGSCNRRLAVGRAGRPGHHFPSYQCTAEGCPGPRVGVRMSSMDEFVTSLLTHAIVREVPEVIAVLAGDDRYQRALEAVEKARTELETFIAEVSIADIGKDAWIAGKKAREGKLAGARKQLRDTPAPLSGSAKLAKMTPATHTYEQVLPEVERVQNARYIHRVLVKPVGRGKRVPIGERVEVYFVGSDEPYDLTNFNLPPADLTTKAAV
jgi:DNA invertase Pin-like site-specific DNA recombinase